MDYLQHFPFSNFDDMHAPIVFEGIEYPTVEHFFQAMKCRDISVRLRIANAPGPGAAKSMGRKCRMRDDWKDIRYDVMLHGLLHKFAVGTHWRKLLDATKGQYIVEWNTWHDNIWGQCQCFDCRSIKGQNLLGKALMAIRDVEIVSLPSTRSF